MIRLRKKASHKKVLRSEMKPLTSKIIRGITHQIRPSTSTSMGMHNFAAGIPHLCERASELAGRANEGVETVQWGSYSVSENHYYKNPRDGFMSRA